jgi:uncharacterized membrane protein
MTMNMERMKLGIRGVAMDFMSQLTPAANAIFEIFRSGGGETSWLTDLFFKLINPLNWVAVAFKIIASVIVVVIGLFKALSALIGGTMEGLWAAVNKLRDGDFKGAWQAAKIGVSAGGDEADRILNKDTSAAFNKIWGLGQDEKKPEVPKSDRSGPPPPDGKGKTQKQIDLMERQLRIAQLQAELNSTRNESEKAYLELLIKQAQIEETAIRARAAIPEKASPAKRKELLGLIDSTQAMENVAAINAYYTKIADIAKKTQDEVDARKAASAISQAQLAVDQKSVEIETMKAHAILTTGEVAKLTQLERSRAEDEYHLKVLQHEEEARKAIAKVKPADVGVDLSKITSEMAKGANANRMVISDAIAHMTEEQVRYAADVQDINDKLNAQTAKDQADLEIKKTQIAVAGEKARADAITATRQSAYIEQLTEFQHMAEKLPAMMAAPLQVMIAMLLKKANETLDKTEALAHRQADAIGQSLDTAFTTAIRGGGWKDAAKSIAESFTGILTASFHDMVAKWMKDLERVALGKAPVIGYDSNNNPIYGQAPTEQQQRRAQNLEIGLQGASAIYGLYQNGQSGVGKGANALAGAASGAALGAEIGSIYPIIGTVVGAVVGAIVGAIVGFATGKDKQKDYQYGVPIFVNGRAQLVDTKNLQPAAIEEMQAKMQAVFNTTWNGFVKVMLALPGGKVPGMPGGAGGPFQSQPSGHWAEHWQQYVDNTLPKVYRRVVP